MYVYIGSSEHIFIFGRTMALCDKAHCKLITAHPLLASVFAIVFVPLRDLHVLGCFAESSSFLYDISHRSLNQLTSRLFFYLEKLSCFREIQCEVVTISVLGNSAVNMGNREVFFKDTCLCHWQIDLPVGDKDMVWSKSLPSTGRCSLFPSSIPFISGLHHVSTCNVCVSQRLADFITPSIP